VPLNNDLYLGFDGGGTKTVCVLGDGKGRILAAAAGPSTNLKSRPAEQVEQTIKDLLAQVLPEDVPIKSVHVSTAGGDRPEDQSRWKNWLLDYGLNPAHIAVENDAVGALAAGTGSKTGTVLIAGTGSIAYSIRGDLAMPIRVGGWGYLFGDEGSGYEIGSKALQKIACFHDGREEEDKAFINHILAQLGLSSPAELITFIYENSYPRQVIALIAKFVLELAQRGNPTAKNLINDAANALTQLVFAIYRNDFKSAEYPLVVSGGLFESDFFKKQFETMMTIAGFEQTIIVAQYPPVIGSYICALLQDSKELTEEIEQNIRTTWEKKLRRENV
jgi:N-acetylglucosamine kinase-like BadF-type ATPase